MPAPLSPGDVERWPEPGGLRHRAQHLLQRRPLDAPAGDAHAEPLKRGHFSRALKSALDRSWKDRPHVEIKALREQHLRPRFHATDLGCSNGTTVDGTPLQPGATCEVTP